MKNIYKKISLTGALGILLGFVFACTEEEPLNMAPSFKMNEPANIMRTSVKFSGSITGDIANISEYGFDYSLSEDFTSSLTTRKKVGESLSSNSYELEVTGLEANERYYYRMYASTGASTVYSASEYFQTLASSIPTFSDIVVDSIGENFASFRCTIEEIGDEYLIEYGVGYKTSADKTYIPIPSDSIVPVSIAGAANTFFVQITGLEPATKYSFRPYAKNSADANGDTGTREGYGTVVTHTTDNQLSAQVETLEPSEGNIGINTAELSGRVISAIGSDGVVDEVGFCYSQTNMMPIITDNHVTATFTKLNEYFTVTITGLQTGTTYYVRAYAKNTVNGQERISYGAVYEITTFDLATPRLEWVQVKDTDGNVYYDDKITASSFSRRAKITNYDKGVLVEKGYVWSTNLHDITVAEARKNGTILTVDVTSGGGNIIDGVITGLKANTSYYVRAYAIYQAVGLEEIGYTDSNRFTTKDVVFPNYSIGLIESTINSMTFLFTINRPGDGEIIEKGIAWMRTPEDDRWYNFSFEEADGHIATETLTHDADTIVIPDLEIATSYLIKGYTKIKVDGEIYTAMGSSLWGVATHGLNLRIEEKTSTDTEISLTGQLHDSIEGVTEYGFCWSTDKISPSEMTNMIKASVPDENNQFKATITGLKMDTKYYLGLYVKIGAKVYYSGSRWDITTKKIPTIDNNPSPGIK